MILNLKQARRLKEKTQDEMAVLLKMHVQSYRKLEENPDLVTVGQAKQIADFLGISYDEIFFWCLNLFKIARSNKNDDNKKSACESGGGYFGQIRTICAVRLALWQVEFWLGCFF